MKKLSISILTLAAALTLQAQTNKEVMPKPGPAPEIKLAKPVTFTLENGLQVFVVENHKLPTVSYSLQFDFDPVLEKEAKGFTEITGDLLSTGTTNRTKDQIDEEIDFIGATFNTYSEGIYAKSLKKHQTKLLDIMSDVLLHPAFKQEELEKLIKKYKDNLKTEKDNPEAIAANVRKAVLYGKNHPYGEVMTEETLDNITVEVCKNYYNTYFKPNAAYLAIVGNITPDEAKKLVEKYFGQWQKGEVPTHQYDTPAEVTENRVVFSNKNGAVQSVVNITYPIHLKPGSPDEIPAKVMNGILGGGSSARLFRNLRETHSYTYGAYSRISSDILIGNFRASASVKTPVTDSSVTEFLYEMKQMRKEKPTDEEVDGEKNYQTGIFAYRLQSPQTIAQYAINIKKYNLPEDYYANYLKNLAKVTADDVYAMAQKYIRPEQSVILVVGDKDEVADKLKKFDADGKIEFYDSEGNPVKEENKPLPEGLTADKVFEDYILAKTQSKSLKEATKKLKKIKSEVTKSEASMQGQTLTFTTYRQKPNKFAMVIKMGSMVVNKQVFDGTKGKTISMQGNKDLEGDELEAMKQTADMLGLVKRKEYGYKMELVAIENIDGKDAYKIKVTAPSGDVSTEFYDVNTHLKVKEISVKETEQGSFTIESTYDDYREVNGMLYPFKIRQSFGPQAFDLEVKSVEINTKIPADTFSVE